MPTLLADRHTIPPVTLPHSTTTTKLSDEHDDNSEDRHDDNSEDVLIDMEEAI